MFRRLFRVKIAVHWDIPDKDIIDEVIFKTPKTRDPLIIELISECGARISEVLKLTSADLDDRKLLLKEPKKGKSPFTARAL